MWTISNLGQGSIASPVKTLQFIHDSEPAFSRIDKLPPLEKAGPRSHIFFEPSQVIAGLVTCGGICPALNNVIRAIVNTLHYKYNVQKILGFKYGYAGLNPESSSILELDPKVVRDIHQFGGSILGSSRGPQPINVMVDYLVSLKVSILFTIGGDGTLKGAHEIYKEIEKRGLKISVIGLPKTIDNDIAYISKTFGFDTAVQMALPPILAAHEEARSAYNGIGIVKLMGRESGFIALNASLASGDVNLLLLPETKFSIDEIIKYLLARFQTSCHCLIVVSEGAGQEECSAGMNLGKDASGNPIFSDVGLFLKNQISKRLKELRIDNTIKYIDPSYTIRSAPCISSDAIFAVRLGQHAVHAAMAGKTGMIVGMVQDDFVHLPIQKVVEFRKKVNIHGSEFQAFLDASGMPLSLVV